jgi:hypothetical protein
MFSIKPYTAGIRGLSIEGDLGEDSIERILEALQDNLPWKYSPLEKFFDIVVGTGAGLSTHFSHATFKGGLTFGRG